MVLGVSRETAGVSFPCARVANVALGRDTPRSSGSGRTRPGGAAGARVLAGGAEPAAGPGRRLGLAGLTGREAEGEEGAAVGGSDLQAEVFSGNPRREVHRLGEGKTQPRASPPARVSRAARRAGAPQVRGRAGQREGNMRVAGG